MALDLLFWGELRQKHRSAADCEQRGTGMECGEKTALMDLSEIALLYPAVYYLLMQELCFAPGVEGNFDRGNLSAPSELEVRESAHKRVLPCTT